MNTQEYLKTIDEVIEKGPYKDTWESLMNYPVPDWYQQAKFGIFIHWGVYSVPAFGNEWYPRKMYLQGTPEFEHHVKTYGPQKEFGYKDFIPMFKGEKFDPAAWADLFQRAGAKYVVPVAEHHDGFQMYKSDLSPFNAYEMGPHRDVLGELKPEIEKRGMTLGASNHRVEHLWFMDGGLDFDSDVRDPKNSMFYGGAYGNVVHSDETTHHGLESDLPTKEFMEDWLVRVCEIVDRYQPKLIWFDWWIQNRAVKPYLRKFAAYYYNRAKEWGVQVAINYKYDAYMYTTAVFDIERGQLNTISPRLWQNDTAIAKNSWGYTDNNEFKKPEDLVCDLVDIVSKNGCLLLNVGPRADGTITDEDTHVLEEIGKWLAVNGEGIYGTTYWRVYGEGPTQIPEGAFTDVDRAPFTSEDIRFTFKNGYLYAFVMKFPEDGVVRIADLKEHVYKENGFQGLVEGVSILGYDNPLEFEQKEHYGEIRVKGRIDTAYPVCFKVKLG